MIIDFNTIDFINIAGIQIISHDFLTKPSSFEAYHRNGFDRYYKGIEDLFNNIIDDFKKYKKGE